MVAMDRTLPWKIFAALGTDQDDKSAVHVAHRALIAKLFSTRPFAELRTLKALAESIESAYLANLTLMSSLELAQGTHRDLGIFDPACNFPVASISQGTALRALELVQGSVDRSIFLGSIFNQPLGAPLLIIRFLVFKSPSKA